MPTINVNLTPCTTAHTCCDGHRAKCPAAPVLIPCPIPPTATFTVRLGECIGCERGRMDGQHFTNCPARPVTVSCSIGGDGTLARSEVVDWYPDKYGAKEPSAGVLAALGDACRARWEIVKALLGVGSWADAIHPFSASVRIGELRDQRDTVFAALADMARCERDYWAAAKAVFATMPTVYVSSDMQVVDPGDPDGDAPSARWLAAYVSHLTDAVGAL